MTRTWKTLAVTAAFVAVLTGGRCTAQTIDPAPAAPKADDLRQELDQLRSNTIRSFQAAKKEIDAMKEDIAHLRKDLDEVRNAKAFTRRKSEDAATGAATQTTRKELESAQRGDRTARQEPRRPKSDARLRVSSGPIRDW